MTSPPPAFAEPHGPAILVVDDDPVICASLSALLESEGYAVEVASLGPAAIAALEQRQFKLAILDIALQHIDGVHIAQYLRKKWPAVRIAIHSGTDEADVRRRFSDYDAFFSKAQPVNSLLDTVRQLVR